MAFISATSCVSLISPTTTLTSLVQFDDVWRRREIVPAHNGLGVARVRAIRLSGSALFAKTAATYF